MTLEELIQKLQRLPVEDRRSVVVVTTDHEDPEDWMKYAERIQEVTLYKNWVVLW